MNLVFHPIAEIFPLLEGKGFEELVDDIYQVGLREPIWLYEGQVLDGRNRYRACEQLDIPCPARFYEGDDPVGFVVSLNLRRRHLDESQRGMVAARLANMRQGERTDLVEIPTKFSQAKAASLLNVSRQTVNEARKVQQDTIPEVIHAVDQGAMTIAAALPLAEAPKTDQAALLAEAEQLAAGKRPTATHTRAVVNRAHVVATVKEQLADGKTPQQAVAYALERHEIVTPTPALADAVAQATGRQVLLPATDGLLHDGRTKAEEATIMAQTKRLFQLFNALEALATLSDMPALIEEIPAYQTYRVEQYLDQACVNLKTFAALWEELQHDPA